MPTESSGPASGPAMSTRVVVLGASGMLGSTLFRELSGEPGLDVRGTVRERKSLPAAFLAGCGDRIVAGVDVLDDNSRRDAIAEADVVINAVGVTKQSIGLKDTVATVRINALLPQQLAADCVGLGVRLVHVSTDCVFSGRRGSYTEADLPDPLDLYGRSKLLGEVEGSALTLRTSIIGHELQRHASLVDWFLAHPQTAVAGFRNAIFSGVTTHEFARLMAAIVIPDPSLRGLYHVAAEPIAKFDLLELLAGVYGWTGQIEIDTDFVCDRSMRADRFFAATGYRPPSWPEMVSDMFEARPDWAMTPVRTEPR